MLFTHAAHPERRVRLGYCLNLHPAEDVAGVRAGLEAITLPLRERLAPGARFGVGPWLSAAVARELAHDAAALESLAGFLADHGLDPFTYNAFPFGGFHAAGLKERVFEPTWAERERLAFTLDVATVAARLAEATGAREHDAHLSISTHPGFFGPPDARPGALEACAENFARCVDALAQIEERIGLAIVLSLEAEPRACAGDSATLATQLAWMHERGAEHLAAREGLPKGYATELLRRHLGTCLDACHAAVEFEPPERALAAATRGGSLLGKLQFSSALALEGPARHPGGVDALLALAEPRYLHQVTGQAGERRERATDLPELAAALADPARRAAWEACSEWRCHFHVPVDLAAVGDAATSAESSGEQVGGAALEVDGATSAESSGAPTTPAQSSGAASTPAESSGAGTAALGTTRDYADRLLRHALADPACWGTHELHVEIETYTWDVLPGPARGAGELVDGLEREYVHVLGLLDAAGWRRA